MGTKNKEQPSRLDASIVATHRPGADAEMTGTKLAVWTGILTMYCFVACLIVFSMLEMFKTICEIVRDIDKNSDIVLAGALAAALVPSGAMLFWVWKAIATDLYPAIHRVRQNFGTQSQI